MRRLFHIAAVAFLAAGFLSSAAAQSSPHVEFNGENAGPRAIEDLTSQSVPRDYAFAWQNMMQALNENRADLLNAYFTGFAKTDLAQRIKQQAAQGIHVRYEDRGHKLSVLFYSPNGDAMQLQDVAQLEMQVFDGSKIINEQPLTMHYMVLMTPGADRWMVRDLRAVPEGDADRAK
jgi:hypothetical protein